MRERHTGPAQRGRSLPVVAFWSFAAVALALMLTEHRAHAWGWAWHALLLGACIALLVLLIRAGGDDGSDRGR
jgi:xanthine/uracil permease